MHWNIGDLTMFWVIILAMMSLRMRRNSYLSAFGHISNNAAKFIYYDFERYFHDQRTTWRTCHFIYYKSEYSRQVEVDLTTDNRVITISISWLWSLTFWHGIPNISRVSRDQPLHQIWEPHAYWHSSYEGFYLTALVTYAVSRTC